MGTTKEPVGDDDPTALLIAPSAARTVVGPTTGARVEVTETIDDPRLAGRAGGRSGSREEATEVLGAPTSALQEGTLARTESALLNPPAPQEGTLALTESALLAPGAQEETLALSGSRAQARRGWEETRRGEETQARGEETQARTVVRPPALTRLRSSMQGTLLWINVICGVLILVGLAVLLWRS